MNYCKLIVGGRITRKPEVRYMPNGTAVCAFGVAVNRKFKDAQGEQREDVLFLDVAIFGKRGEAFAKYHDKGAQTFLEGRLALDQWDDKQTGEKRSKHKMIVDEWQFVGGRGEGERSSASSDDRAPAATGVTRPMASGDPIDDTPF